MKRIFVVIFICAFSLTAHAQTIIAGTFNLRFDNPRDTGNLWKDRSPIAANLIRFHQFDIVGTQEGLINQINDLQTQLPEFAHYGIGRDDGKSGGEHSTIFYRKDKYDVIDSGDFWLSEHPEKPGFGWDAHNNRICSWLKLKMKSGRKTFYVFNVHYDHQGVVARKESSKLILQKIKSIAGNQPVIFTGDFNGNNQTEWYKTINESGMLSDVLPRCEHPYINNGSFNSFRIFNPSNELIDHVFTTSAFKVKRYGILTDSYHGHFPSDHFPVLAELTF
jgi:endonuclease/exonuclease/phosphatase family metal-dependent hydrolase